VEGVVAAEDEVVERNPLPASKCTHSKPLTPGSEGTTASLPKAPRALDGLSILYLRNSTKGEKYRESENLSKHFLPETRISLISDNSYSLHNIDVSDNAFM
jgi:hypothetical protein